jgi:hypothetical protein
MTKKNSTSTVASLMRFDIEPDNFINDYEVWTLDLPEIFRDAFFQFKSELEGKLKNKVSEYIGIPFRLLNNTLIAIFPAIVYGFEPPKKDAERRSIYTCLAIGNASIPAQLPDLEDVRHVIREWAQLWTESKYISENIPADEIRTMKSKLMEAVNSPLVNWSWKRIEVNKLLDMSDSNENIKYKALPSFLAALLHGKTSNIHGKQIQWRKVQDGTSQKLSVIGFINRRPISAQYSINEYQMNKTGDGYFAYKFEFSLQTQAGRSRPWMFVSLHAQRYADKPLTHPNDRRRVSILTAANRQRLDDFHKDTTLINLRTREVEKKFDWNDNISELLVRINAIPLRSPNDIFAEPQNHWQPLGLEPDFRNDEYYIVHAEGYGYGENEEGHQIEAGFSMTDTAEVLEKVISEHLPILKQDSPLNLDDFPAPSGKKKPLALNDYTTWSVEPPMKPVAWGSKEKREEERTQRYIQQRSKFQVIMTDSISRALRGGELLIVILWNTEDTRAGILKALREALLLNPGDDYPSNIKIEDHYVSSHLLEKMETKEMPYEKAHHVLMTKWREFIKEKVTAHNNRMAIIETFGKGKSWGVKGAAREACVREGITSQMVESIRMKEDESGSKVYLGGPRNHEHRANSVAYEAVLRHIGILFGDPKAIYEAAGVSQENLELLTFFLMQTKTNIRYPVAVKIAYDGAIEVRLPQSNGWLLYREAAPTLGKVFASEWHNTAYGGQNKRKIRDIKKNESRLYLDKTHLNNFILDVLKGIKNPTIAVIEADNWRNYDIWPQINNNNLVKSSNVLDFSPHDRVYQRTDPIFRNLLAMVRIRSGVETPQYLTNTHREFTQLTGFVDDSTGEMMHYFSIGRQLVTGRGQRHPSTRHATMVDGIGAGVAYKYPQVVEFVPFFVREDYANPVDLKKICRIPHYLRISPAWPQGNIVLPYPMHLGHQLVDDQLCILAMED